MIEQGNTVKVLLTGSSGFVGKSLVPKVLGAGFGLATVSRGSDGLAKTEHYQIAQLNGDTDWTAILATAKPDVVIHAAARVHQMNDLSEDPLQAFRQVNTDGTMQLARQAAATGVKRFIFVSTIKVNGENTDNRAPFSHLDTPAPQDPYAISKSEAELQLRQLARDTAMEVVIIRPPLVYGPGVKANFAAMLRLAGKNLPLPLGAVHNRRSMVALDNLVDLIVTCIHHPKAANQVFLSSDDRDISTSELLRLMTRAAGKTPFLVPVPVSWLRLLAKLAGKQAIIDRLCGNLQLDISHTKQVLGWQPVVTVEQGIARCLLKEEVC